MELQDSVAFLYQKRLFTNIVLVFRFPSTLYGVHVRFLECKRKKTATNKLRKTYSLTNAFYHLDCKERRRQILNFSIREIAFF